MRITCLNDKKVFLSAKEVAEYYNLSYKHLLNKLQSNDLLSVRNIILSVERLPQYKATKGEEVILFKNLTEVAKGFNMSRSRVEYDFLNGILINGYLITRV